MVVSVMARVLPLENPKASDPESLDNGAEVHDLDMSLRMSIHMSICMSRHTFSLVQAIVRCVIIKKQRQGFLNK